MIDPQRAWLACCIIKSIFMLTSVGSVRFTAITDDANIMFLDKLYREEWNNDAPSELDPANDNPSVRQQICEDITSSGFLAGSRRKPIRTDRMYDALNRPNYYDLFQRIYSPTKSRDLDGSHYEYSNPYTLQQVNVITFFPGQPYRPPQSVYKSEYVFVCLIKQLDSEDDSDGAVNSRDDDVSSTDTDEDGTISSASNQDNSETISNEESIVNDDENPLNRRNITEDVETGEQNAHRMFDEYDSENHQPEDSIRGDLTDTIINDGNFGQTSNTDENRSISITGTLDQTNSSDDGSSYRIVPFYVSKAYSPERGLHVHRFLFWEKGNTLIMLAEESAKVYVKPDFNVELHYLELRKRHQPVSPTTPQLDPVAKLIESPLEDRQLFRLCATVFTATDFKRTIEYPKRMQYNYWSYSPVSFRTAEGRENSAGNLYNELMLRCHVNMIDGRSKIFYVSRAYNPNEVFVYIRTLGVYLQSLVKNVHIVHEAHNFGHVEI